MNLAMYRWSDETFIKVIVAVFIASIIGYIPNYQRSTYKNTPAVTYSKYEDQTGYPVGSGFQYITSVEDMKGLKNFAIMLDVKDLHPTNQYMDIINGKYCRNAFWRAAMNNESHGIGQFYSALLPSGEKIIVFLDDTTINLPKEGKVTLPVGKIDKIQKDDFFTKLQNNEQIADENANWYVDMAGKWRLSEQAEHIETIRVIIIIIMFVILVILQTILFKKLKIQ